MAQSLGAADSVVSRAGATTILELSALASRDNKTILLVVR
ncbi:MAG TPA: glycosyltransferase [Ktedonobacteraceae bacterium]